MQADHTVLLKLREGSEYKLVLNMQEFAPENITVKLVEEDGQRPAVTVTARSKDNADEFVQRHVLPDGIDTDRMASSFSADGILVIKAPRKS